LNEYFFIAKITSSGKDGFVKTDLISGISDRLDRLKIVYLDFWGKKKKFFIEDISRQKKSFFLKFKNFDSDRDIQVLIGREVFTKDKNDIKLPDGRYFIKDLIGSEVFRDGIIIGFVKDVFESPANDVIEIINSDGKEILLPFVPEYFENVDPESKIIILKSGAGVYDDED
jgi:16S rRNA processing protein RimM